MTPMDSRDPKTWRVLVIEDEIDSLDLLLMYLKFLGAEVQGAQNGQIGLGMVDSFRPNLILLDLTMPVLDGWKLQQILRARPSVADIPIIAVTALVMPEERERVRAARFDGYISKPFRVAELLPRLTEMIDQFKQRSAGTDTSTKHDEHAPTE